MEQLNRIEVETRGGNRTFELLCGDIVELEGDVDLLIVSAVHSRANHNNWREQYSNHWNSAIGAIQRHLSIDFTQLQMRPDLDFRSALACWVSSAPQTSPFRHILCVEVDSDELGSRKVKRMFSNIFATIAALEAKDYKLRTIAMPLLGTGRGRLEPDVVMREMLDHSLVALEHSRVLSTVQFVLRDEDRALQFSDAMDRVLGRLQTAMPQSAAIKQVRRKIAGRIETAAILSGDTDNPVFDELRKAILSTESRPFILGVAARKMTEFIIHDLTAGKDYKDANAGIDALRKQSDGGPALWIIHYMDVIRTLGNNGAHASVKHHRLPAHPTQADLELLLLCLLRVLDFWIERKKTPPTQADLLEEVTAPALVDDPLLS